MEEVVPKMACRRGSDSDNPALPTSRRSGAVPDPLKSGGPKWRGIFPEGFDHPVPINRLEFRTYASLWTT